MDKRFSQQWLSLVCKQLPGATAAVCMVPDASGQKLVTLARWPQQFSNAAEFSKIVQYILKKREPVCFAAAVTEDQQAFDLFAVPVNIGAKVPGALVVKLKSQPESRQKAIFSRLKLGLQYLQLTGEKQVSNEEFYSRIVGLLAACFEQEGYQKGLVSMVTELTRAFDCERVAYAEYRGHYNRVVALSNSASFDQRSNLMQKIGDVMDEAMDQDNVIVFPDDGSKLIQRAHQELARKYGSGSILTVPLVYNQQRFGAITLLRSEDTPFDQNTLRLCQQTFALLTPYLALQREQERNLFAKIGTSLKYGLQRLFGVRGLAIKLGSLAALALLVSASLVQGEYRITADAALEGKIQRVVSAPFAGYLLSASVRAGDIVEQGQALASLNDSDLRLQLSKLRG